MNVFFYILVITVFVNCLGTYFAQWCFNVLQMLLNALLILPPPFHTIRFASKQVYSKFAKKIKFENLALQIGFTYYSGTTWWRSRSGLQTQKYEAMPCQTLFLSLTHIHPHYIRWNIASFIIWGGFLIP